MGARSCSPRAHHILIVAGCLIWAEWAWAGPPFVTDDPEPVDLHHWEVYASSVQGKDPTGTSGTCPHAEANYGAARNLQLHVIFPYAFSRPRGHGTALGYGDTEFGAKYRFVEQTHGRPMVGTFPLLEVPSGDAGRGLGGGTYRLFLPIWLQKSSGAWTSYGGGGYWINPGAGNRNYWLFGWEIQRNLSEHLTLGGEVLRSTPAVVGDQSNLSFNLGGQYNLDEGHHILFSAGRSLRGTTAFTGYLGFQWTFGPRASATEPAAASQQVSALRSGPLP